MIRRILPWLILGVVLPLCGFLLYRQLKDYSLEEVLASIAAMPLANLSLAVGCAAASYLCLTGFDSLAVRYAGYRFPYRKVALASFVSLSLGHNIGIAALSSGAVRYRFYSRLGMRASDVAKVILFCGLTVGLGLMILAGSAFLLSAGPASEMLGLETRAPVVLLGAACLSIAALYLALAAFLRRPIQIRQWSLAMPRLRLAIGQVILGPLNFACVAGCLYFALAALAEVGYLEVATAYLIGNAAGLLSHVPGGLGVLESVVLLLLPAKNAIAALVVFRVVYFLLPLVLGGTLFAIFEFVLFSRKRASNADARTT